MASTLSRRDLICQAKGLALATPFLGLVACDGGNAGRRLTKLRGATMGTTYGVKVTDLPASVDPHALKTDIDRILETVNQQMSTYRPESELSRFNAAGSRSWFRVSADTLTVIEEALGIGRLTDGAFDPTVGPLVGLWGFGADGGEPRVPSAEAIADVRRKVGYRRVRTRLARLAVAKSDADIRVDLSGIAKGFAVDRLAEHLEGQGVAHYLV
jgi:thiamine biosynthesis lipoprotein